MTDPDSFFYDQQSLDAHRTLNQIDQDISFLQGCLDHLGPIRTPQRYRIQDTLERLQVLQHEYKSIYYRKNQPAHDEDPDFLLGHWIQLRFD